MKNKLTSLIAGPTDRTKIFRFANLSESNYETHLDELAESLIKYVSRVNIIPDQGVPFDLAKKFKRKGGEAIGYVPQGGGDLFKDNFREFDDIREFDGSWSALNTCLSLRGDLITTVGMSPGTIVEVAYTKYHEVYLGRRIPVLIDTKMIPWTIPEFISEELDLRYFGNMKQFETYLKQIQESKE